MSDTARFLLIFLLMPAPLYIPIAVTIVAAIADWRETLRMRWSTKASSHPAIAIEEPRPLPGSRYPAAITPRPQLDPPPTQADTEAA
jgi:hypothetical protein